jgi:hypothetical protein
MPIAECPAATGVAPMLPFQVLIRGVSSNGTENRRKGLIMPICRVFDTIDLFAAIQ